jgi:predicted cupin superfamily sugar epimerase
MITAEYLIRQLNLKPLPREGGYFAETYRSPVEISQNISGRPVSRNLGTAIYYLLTPDTFSSMHQLRGDEVFHFYLGDPVEMLQLKADGTGELIILGPDIERGMRPQALVPGGVWQGSRLAKGGRFALMGTTMSPGFDFADYARADRRFLIKQYPDFRNLIETLTPCFSG